MLTSVVVARILGVSAFGQFSMIRSTLLMLGVLAGTGLGIAATRHVAEFREKNSEQAGRMLALLSITGLVVGLSASVLCFAFAETLAVSVMHSETLVTPLRISCLLLALNTLNGIGVGILSGLEAYRAVATSGALEGLLNLCCVIGGAWLNGMSGAVFGLIVASAIALSIRCLAVKYASARFSIPLYSQGWWAEMPILRQVAIPAILISASIQPFEWFGRVMLGHQTNGLSEVGIFAVVQSWAQVMLMLPAQVTVPSMAILASLYANGDHLAFRNLIFTNIKLVTGLGIVVAIPIIIFSRQILGLYGSSFASGVPALIVMVGTYSIAVITMVFTEALVASDRVWIQTSQKFLWGATMIGAAYFLVGHGAVGLAFAYAIANFFFLCAQTTAVISLARTPATNE